MIESYQAARKYLDHAGKAGSRYGLETERELLKRLGNPEQKLRVIHVAGTNGKGSVCAYLSSILQQGGYRVGRFVSPVLFGYRERIQVDSIWISREHVTEHMQKIEAAAGAMEAEGWDIPTVFEMETAMAFLEFAGSQCDAVVLETGLGGRLDSTNVVESVCLGVLTSIGMDHKELLGDTLEAIAREKCGIIKPGMFVVSAQQKPEVQKVICRVCKEKGVSLIFADAGQLGELSYTLDGTSWTYHNQTFATRLLGTYQPENALTALLAAQKLGGLGFSLSWKNLQKGIEEAEWKGRFSVISREPLILVDGAHNVDGARRLHESEEVYFGGQPLQRVIGVFADKDYEAILKETVRKQDQVFAVTAPGPRGLSSSCLAECAQRYCDHVEDVGDLGAALQRIQETEKTTVIYGSLSFLGEVYQWQKEGEKLCQVPPNMR